MYRALLASANRLERQVRLIVPGPRYDVEDVGPFGRIYYVKAPAAFAFDPRYRIILPSRYFLPAAHSVAGILRAEQPDVVEICDKFSLFYVAGLLRKEWMPGVRRPVLVGASAERFDDGVGAFISRGERVQRLARWYMRNIYTPMFDYHVANSEYTAAELRDALPAHRQHVVHVCPPGVDLDGLDAVPLTPGGRSALRVRVGADARSVVLLYAGRLSPEKNVQLLIDLLALLTASEERDRRNYRLVVAGDGPLLGRLRQEAEQRCPERVTFLGSVSDRAAYRTLLSAADFFVHPNPREPFGIAPLEAMAAGLPAVLPNAGGVLTYASEDTAWLAAPSANSFVRAIRDAVRQPDVAAAKAVRARRRAEALRFSDLFDRMFRLYDHFHQERIEAHAQHVLTAGLPIDRDRAQPVAGH